MPRITLLIAWFILLSGSIGCALGSNVAQSDSLPAGQRQTDNEMPKDSRLMSLDELKPGQNVRLVARITPPEQSVEGTNIEQNVLEMVFALDKMTGTVVSTDSDNIVLRDVVITTDRVVKPGWLGFITAPLVFSLSGGVIQKRDYVEVPGDVSVSRKVIRCVEEMSEADVARLQTEVSDVRPKYVVFDFRHTGGLKKSGQNEERPKVTH